MKRPKSVDALFAAATAGDPTLPVFTFYDDRSGERVELSGATLDNWRAKTANLLADECGLGPGDRAQVLLPPHWQTAAVLLGCWAAGLAVGGAAADVVFGTPQTAGALDPEAADRYVLGLAPLGMPMRGTPAGLTDYVAAVRAQGDHFPGGAAGPDTPAWDDGGPPLLQAQLCAEAADRAAALGIPPRGRVLLDAVRHPDPRDWLLAPLAAGASVVLCADLSALPPDAVDRRRADERITHTVGPGPC